MTIGYKKCRDNKIVELEILGQNNENRPDIYDKNFAKMRCSKARVLKIYDMFDESLKYDTAFSMRCIDSDFAYKVGKIVEPDYYDSTIETVCTNGIHYFLTKEAAFGYGFREYLLAHTYTGEIVDYFDDGRIHYRYNYVNGLLEGIVIGYFQNGEIDFQQRYEKDKLNGISEVYHFLAPHFVSRRISFKNGVKDGIFESFYENGKIEKRGNYKDGKEIGLFESWDSNGRYKAEPVDQSPVYRQPVYQQVYQPVYRPVYRQPVYRQVYQPTYYQPTYNRYAYPRQMYYGYHR